MTKRILSAALATLALAALVPAPAPASTEAKKPGPAEALALLKEGNERFVAAAAQNPRSDAARCALAGRSNQGDYAYATVLSCSDSRVPVERIFDAGVMDLFVVRIAGNVVDVDEAGSIEYGLAHVNTPVLVVLGHTQCGAVTAVAAGVEGHGHALERNIPPLVDNIGPAVRRAMAAHPDLHGAELVPHGIEENVWQSVEDLFLASPATRALVAAGKVKVVGAVYDVASGKVGWLPEEKVAALLEAAEASPKRAVEAMAAEPGEAHASPEAAPAAH